MDAHAWLLEAQRCAEWAHDLMMSPAGFDSYDWGVVTSRIVGAAEALRSARKLDPTVALPLLDEAIEELRDISANFTRPEFLDSTRASRRQSPELFVPRPKAGS